MFRSTRLATVLLVATGTAIADGHESKTDAALSDVEAYTCKDVMVLDDTREAVIAFLHGYLMGKNGEARFDPERKGEQTDRFVDNCLDNPNKKALEVLSES